MNQAQFYQYLMDFFLENQNLIENFPDENVGYCDYKIYHFKGTSYYCTVVQSSFEISNEDCIWNFWFWKYKDPIPEKIPGKPHMNKDHVELSEIIEDPATPHKIKEFILFNLEMLV